MRWQEALRRGGAVADFASFIGHLRDQAQRQQDDAASLDIVRAAVAVKKVLDTVLRNVTLDTEEEAAHGRVFGQNQEG